MLSAQIGSAAIIDVAEFLVCTMNPLARCAGAL